MKIGELARRSGLTTSRIRFYEASGLLQSVERQANGYRAYPPEALMVLEIITGAQKAGFSLDEVRNLLPADLGNWQHDDLTLALQRKVSDIEALEQRLAHSKAHLLGVIDSIRDKPVGMACAENAKQVLGRMRDAVLAGAVMTADDARSLRKQKT